MWCIFIIAHHFISSNSWIQVGHNWLNPSHEYIRVFAILTAILVFISILNPKKIIWFVLTLIFWSLLKIDNLPLVPNHIILALVVNFCILLGIYLNGTVEKSKEKRLGNLYNSISPILRWNLIILYFFTVFHKLNVDYFNPNVSCAVSLYHNISGRIALLPNSDFVNWSLIIGSLIIEALIPVLLLIPRSRLIGVVLGLCFHLLLSFHTSFYITSFSLELYALYVLFLPNNIFISIIQGIKKKRNFISNYTRLNRFPKNKIFYLTLILFVLSVVYLILVSFQYDIEYLIKIKVLFRFVWYVIASIIILIFFILLKRNNIVDKENIFRLKKNILLVFPLILIMNGVSPYFGIKTSTNFSMFSNLKTVGTENNSLIIPSNLDLVKYSSDLVEIIESDDEHLNMIKIKGEYITFFEFQRWIQEQDKLDESKTLYKRNNELKTLNLPKDKNNQQYHSISWLEKKLLIYRNIPMDDPCPCQW